MPIVEEIKRIAEKLTGIGRPPSSALDRLTRRRRPEIYRFSDDGRIPNNAGLPMVLYRDAMRLDRGYDPAAVIEDIFARNGWCDSWRDGVYPFQHFHTATHEVLGIARGRVTVRFGGAKGRGLTLVAGDVIITGAAEAIARLNGAGFTVAMCTNQPEVARGAMSHSELDTVHDALTKMLAAKGARVDTILCCTCDRKTPRMKPAAGMLREALARFGARPADTPFVGDHADDLKAAFHAGCKPVLVRTGLGRKTLEDGLPAYVGPVAVYDDLAAVAAAYVAY